MANTFETAWQLHVWGYSVIPSGGGQSGKQPLVDWADYQERQPTDDEMMGWQTTYSPELWGIVTNSSVAVIDADTIESRDELCAELGDPHVVTPRQGGHWYVDTTGHRLATRTAILPGMDVRAVGGFCNIAGRSIAGEYTILTMPQSDTLIPFDRLPKRILDAMNGHKTRPGPAEPIVEGKRNEALASIAGAWRREGLEEAEILAGLDCVNTTRCRPPLAPDEVKKIATSIARYTPIHSGFNNYISNIGSDDENTNETGQDADNFGTNSAKKWGELSRRFDEILRETPGPRDKREVAETLGVRVTDDAFRKILHRRTKDEKIRPYRRSPYLIEWINRDYTVTDLANAKTPSYLSLKFPLFLESRVRLAAGNVAAIAGYTSAGKTAWLLEFAELNAFGQPLPISYWFNEMSEAKLALRCEDFPLLIDAQREGRFRPVKQGSFEFADVLDPGGINLIDYLDRNDNLFLIGDDIAQLQARLDGGILIFAIQKRHKQDLGYGGVMSIKRADLYIALDVEREDASAMYGIAEIIKAKDWANDNRNPVHEICKYHTGGKHGRLFEDSEWHRK